MAFCTNCGAQLSDNATVCPACGQPRVPANSPAAEPSATRLGFSAAAPSRVSTSPVTGSSFIPSLFDFSFTSFVTTKLIKILYAIGMVVAAVMAISFAISGFARSAIFGLLTLVVIGPLIFFAAVIYWRVIMELIIVLFRAAEHLEEIARQGRR